jgi:hypothetical protein
VGIAYKAVIQASSREIAGSLHAILTCEVTVQISDFNDQLVFTNTDYHRYIGESAADNTPRPGGTL